MFYDDVMNTYTSHDHAIKTKPLGLTNNMNRKKKLNQEFQKKKKSANQKGNAKNKTPYVSKADRAKSVESTPESDTVLSDKSEDWMP